MNKIDKKQLPQLVALIALSVGVFGFFIFRMLAPTPAAAQSPAVAKSTAANAVKNAAPVEVVATASAPEPSATMRDPFLPSIADATAIDAYQRAQASAAAAQHPAPRPAALRVLPGRRFGRQALNMQAMSVPQVAPLPTLGVSGGPGVQSGQPMPVTAPPAAPVTWNVTGVLGGDGGVAILRDGVSRRIVKQGDVLAGGLRVQHVGRGSVTLERDGQNYRLPLGGLKDAPKTNDAPAKASAPDLAPAAETPAPTAAP